MKTMRIATLSSTIFLATAISMSPENASAGPLRDAAQGVGKAATYVGESVGDTATSVGGSVKDLVTKDDPAAARKEINATEAKTLTRLFKLDAGAKALFDQSYGYAVFDSRKSSFLLTAGGGSGVAVEKASGKRTYMKMLTLGVNAGAGIQYFNGVFLFETREAYGRFVNSGWEADASANATLGKKSLEAQAKFTNGMAYYQLSNTGIMLDANIAGTKYSKDSKLN